MGQMLLGLCTKLPNFFNDGNFNRDVVDLIVQATADALNFKLNIYRRTPAGNIQLLVQESVQPKMTVHLKFFTASACKPSYTGANHHDAVTIISRHIEGKSTCSKCESKEGQVPWIQEEKQENEQDCAIDLTQAETPVKRDMKCIIDVDDMIDLTESPVKYNSKPETEIEDIELEKRSTVSDMGLQFDINKDAMRGFQEEDGSSDTESAQEPVPGTSSEDTRPMNIESNELVIHGETGQAISKEYLRSGVNFPSNLFNKVLPKTYHRVKCTIGDYSKETNDRRWFYIRTSFKTDLGGIRKVGTCQGSWQCINSSCSFLSSEKKPNWWHFEFKGRSRTCFSCGHYASQVPCGARKLVQMSFGSEYADVYHIGEHNCTLQPEVCSDVEYTRKWLERYPGLTLNR